MTKLKEFIDGHNSTLPRIVQAEVAERAGVHPSEFSRICKGYVPDDEVKARIVSALRECTGKDVTVEMLWPVKAENVG